MQKLRRIGGVRQNAADLRGRQEDDVRLVTIEPLLDIRLATEIQLAPIRSNDFAVLMGKAPNDRAADHPAMAGNPDLLAEQIEVRVRHERGLDSYSDSARSAPSA